MESLMVGLIIACGIAIPVLGVIFIVRWAMKKPKKWIGLSVLFCVIGIVVFSVAGASINLANMTPEERAAYKLELEQEATARQAQQEAERISKEEQEADDQSEATTDASQEQKQAVTEDAPSNSIGIIDDSVSSVDKPEQNTAENDSITPKTESEQSEVVDVNEQVILNLIAEDIVKQASKYPMTTKINTMSWLYGQEGLEYWVFCSFSCKNAFGTPESHNIMITCLASEDYSTIEPVVVVLDGKIVADNS